MAAFSRRIIVGVFVAFFSLTSVAQAALTNMLLVVANPASLTARESTLKAGLESYNYTVALIDDDASQANFNSALSGKNVVYVAVSVAANSVGTKLKSTTIGVVNESPALADEFGFSDSSFETSSKNFLRIQSPTHYATYGTSGDLVILTLNQTMVRRTGTLAAGAVNLALVERTPGQSHPGLLSLEVGAALYGGGTATGRRILLPVGDATFNLTALNASGLNIFLKSIEWAARPNPAIGNLLLVATNTSTPTAQETNRRLLIDTWGYNVTLIDDGATQASFNTAMAANQVAYVSEEADATSLGTKVATATIGVVNEDFDLVDEFKIASTRVYTTGTAITVTNNVHYITSPFAAGALTLFSSSGSVGYLSGTLAPGQQTLANWGTGRALVVLEMGAAMQGSGNAAGRRVQLPWGGTTFDFNTINASGKTLMLRAIEWAATIPGIRVLLVVANSEALIAQENERISLLESWGYSTIVIDDDAPQAEYTAALPGCTVVYVSEEANSVSLGTKLTNATIGIVNEEQALTDELGISSSAAVVSTNQLDIASNTHYITSTFPLGIRSIFTTAQEAVSVEGTVASDGKSLALLGTAKTLVALDSGGKLYTDAYAAGRRVQLPWGGGSFDISALNADGQTLMKRSIEWAHGMRGHWKLDETAGIIASDSSGNHQSGTLTGGVSFDLDSVSPGKLADALEFNGSTDYVVIANTSNLQPTTALSISAWIKGNSWGTGTDVDVILRKGEAGSNNYQLAITDGRVTLYLDDTDGAGFKGNTVLQPGLWYHVAATWDGSDVCIYVNGAPDQSVPGFKPAPIGIDSRPLYLGGRAGADLFNGVLDDVRLFGYALTPDEIMLLKGTGQPKSVRIIKWVEIR